MSGILSVVAARGRVGNPSIADRSVSASSTFPTSASAELLFGTDGTLTTYVNNSGTQRLPEWGGFAAGLSGLGPFYQARLTVNSGSSPSGASAGSWLDLSTERRWTLTQGGLGSSSGSWLVEIREKNSETVIDSATYTMTAVVSSP